MAVGADGGKGASRRTAERMREIRPFQVMALLGRARALEAAGRDIVHLEVGEPDFDTPREVCERGKAALSAGHTHYTPAAGLPELRAAISEWYRDRFALEVPATRILVTPGASGALSVLVPALFGPGDEVLLPDPGYPCNRNFLLAAGARPVMVPVDAATGWQLTPDLVAEAWTPRTRGVMLASPSNPTGSVLDRAQSQALIRQVHALGGVVIMDEIYQGLQYDGEPTTALALSDEVFIVNSFSKFFGMTGWRVGWLVAPDWALDALERLAQNLYLAAPTVSQHAALAAFEPQVQAELARRRDAFRARRDALVRALAPLPLTLAADPAGAFYLYLDVSACTSDAAGLCQQLLETHGVAVTPGADFGDHLAGQRIRLAYTTDIDRLEEGVARMAAALA